MRSKEIIKNYYPDIVISLETHYPFSFVKKFWESLGFNECIVEEARGHAGDMDPSKEFN